MESAPRGFGIPGSWHFYLVSVGATLLLAARDVAGAVLVNARGERRHSPFFLGGLACFGILFAMDAASVRVTELCVVTVGWIVVLRVGLLLLGRWRDGVELPIANGTAIGAIPVLQANLIPGPNADAGGA